MSNTSNFASTSYNLVFGAGPNLRSHFKADVEFMFHGLPVQRPVINELGFSNVKGRFYSLSANLIAVASIGGGKGAYLIGGGGWYRRTLEARQTVLQAGTACVPAWVWWNIQCVNGIVPMEVTVGSSIASAAGLNFGGGLSTQIGDSPANLFFEVRYHRAFTKNVDTVVLPLTFGVRF